MRRTGLAAALALVLVASTAAWAFRLEGTVTDADGPVAGAMVDALRWASSDGYLAGTTTDARGHYVLTVDERPSRLIVSLAGRETAIVNVPQRRYEVNVSLKSGGHVLRGCVVRADGSPLYEAYVAVTSLKLAGERSSIRIPEDHPIEALRTTSGGDGGFEICGLPPLSSLIIEARKYRFATVVKPVPGGVPEEPIDLTIVPEATVRGRVMWRGVPVSGVEVSVDNHPDWRTTTTDRGTYGLNRLPPGETRISITPPWMMAVASGPTLMRLTAGQQVRDADLELVRLGVVTGTVTRADTSEPVQGAYVWAGLQAGRGEGTDASGRYLLRYPPGDYEVGVRGVRRDSNLLRRPPDESELPSQVVSLAAGEVVEGVDFVVEPWMIGDVTVSGVARMPDGSPAAYATVSMDLQNGPLARGVDPRDTTTADADGRFELKPNPVRRNDYFLMRAESADGSLIGAAIVHGRGARGVELRLAKPAYARFTVEWDDGRPYVGSVSLHPRVVTPGGGELPWKAKSRVEDEAIVAGPLPANTPLTFIASRPTGRWHRWDPGPVSLEPGETRALPTMVAVPGDAPLLRGRVLDSLERPVADAIVMVCPSGTGGNVVKTRADGGFTIQAAPRFGSGGWTLLAATEDGRSCCAQWLGETTEGERVLVLAEPTALEGTLLSADGKPCTDVSVRAKSSWWQSNVILRGKLGSDGACRTDVVGRWRIEGVVPGLAYWLEAWDPIAEARAKCAVGVVEPGEHEPIELKLEPIEN